VHSQPRRPTVPWATSKAAWQQVEGGDSAPLLHSGESLPGVLPQALEPAGQERHGPVEAGPDPRAGAAPLLPGQAERVGAVQPGEKKALGRLYGGLSVLKGGL